MGHHTPFTMAHCSMHDTAPTHAQAQALNVNHSCSSLQGTHHSVAMMQASETPCGPVLASRAMLSEVRIASKEASRRFPSNTFFPNNR